MPLRLAFTPPCLSASVVKFPDPESQAIPYLQGNFRIESALP